MCQPPANQLSEVERLSVYLVQLQEIRLQQWLLQADFVQREHHVGGGIDDTGRWPRLPRCCTSHAEGAISIFVRLSEKEEKSIYDHSYCDEDIQLTSQSLLVHLFSISLNHRVLSSQQPFAHKLTCADCNRHLTLSVSFPCFFNSFLAFLRFVLQT